MLKLRLAEKTLVWSSLFTCHTASVSDIKEKLYKQLQVFKYKPILDEKNPGLHDERGYLTGKSASTMDDVLIALCIALVHAFHTMQQPGYELGKAR